MRKFLLLCVGFAGLASLSGCVVYDHPRPVVYAYPDYYYCAGPSVVYVHSYYGGGCYYRRGWR